jgi:hypothetical protein
VGIARARNLANGDALPLRTVRRMWSFFQRHDKTRPATPDPDSPWAQAWGLWGGDAGWRWSRGIVRRMEGKMSDEIKAGRRHRASDEAIMKAMRDDWYGMAGKMSDYFKALGFEDEDGDGAVTPDEAMAQADEVKSLDLRTLAEMVEEAVLEALDDLDALDEDEEPDDEGAALMEMAGPVVEAYRKGAAGPPPTVHVYDKYAVACLGPGEDWQIPYAMEAGEVALATPDAWVRVGQEWKPIPGAAPITAMGDAVKLLDDGTIVAQAVRFGSPDEPDMSEMRDYFTKSTNFWLDKWTTRPMLYHHAMDAGTRDDPVIGAWVKAWADDEGVWLQGQLDLAHRYHNAIKELARRGLLRVSTDSAPHLVRRERVGEAHEVKTWPILAASLTPSPAEPRLLPAELKAALADLGITIDDDSPEATGSDPARPDGAKAGDEAKRRLTLELDLLSLETQP